MRLPSKEEMTRRRMLYGASYVLRNTPRHRLVTLMGGPVERPELDRDLTQLRFRVGLLMQWWDDLGAFRRDEYRDQHRRSVQS